MPSLCYIDGEIFPLSEARVPVDDLAFQRGYGVFDFLRTYGGRPFRLRQHLDRLRRSAALVGIELPWGRAELEKIIRLLLNRSSLDEANIRLIVSGGSSPDFLTPPPCPRLVLIVSPVETYPRAWYEEGVALTLARRERSYPEAKTINYLAAVAGIAAARRGGAVEPLLVDREGNVREGETANLFALCSGVLVTPSVGILPGVTREFLLELAREVVPVREQKLSLERLYGAEEAFITATNKEVVPVVRVGERTIGAGRPGPVTRKLMDAFRRKVEEFVRAG